MLMTVREAAERLNVSPHTVRRWTTTGFLRCTRTAGGHRRLDDKDVDDLAALIEHGGTSSAQLSRERELETFVRTSLALASQLDLKDLLVEVAEQMTNLLEGDYCRITAYDASTRTAEILSEFSRTRSSRPFQGYPVSVFPVVERVLQEQKWAVTNLSDSDADVDELRIMKRDGDKSLLVLPMVYQGQSTGLIEVMDQSRERQHAPREMRFAMALAEQAAVAVQNAKAFGELRRSHDEAMTLRAAVAAMPQSVDLLMNLDTEQAVLETLTKLAGEACGGLVSVATYAGRSVGATQPARDEPAPAAGPAIHRERADEAEVITSSATVGGEVLSLTVSLPKQDGEVFAVMLDFLTTAAAVALRSKA